MTDFAKRLSKLEKPEMLRRLRKWHREDRASNQKWFKEANHYYAMKAGDQYSAQEKYILRIEGRPDLVFNIINSTIELINGVNLQNPVDIYPSPTEDSDQFLCDILRDTTDNIDEQSDSLTEEDEAFDDMLVTGRGFVTIDVAPDPERPNEIVITETALPVHEVLLDANGRRNDLKDSGRITHEKWINIDDFVIAYPKFADRIEEIFTGELSAETMADSNTAGDEPGVYDYDDDEADNDDYTLGLDTTYYDRSANQARLIKTEFWESYERFYGFNPFTGQVEEFEEDQLKQLKKVIPNFEHEKVWDKRVMWAHWIGDELLYLGQSPIKYRGFSIIPCFGYKNKAGKSVTHFAIGKLMNDPQREINKRWSQALNRLVNDGTGVMAELDAFEDAVQAQNSWNDPRMISWVTKGAIQEGKIKEKPASHTAMEPMAFEQAAQDMAKKVSGVNTDLLGGQGQRQEPGIVVRLRQQQGLVLLEKLFKSYKHMRKEIYKRKLAIIMEYMPDEQFSRILGQTDRYIIRQGMIVDKENGFIAPIRQVKDLKYNVKISDSPGNITKQMAELGIYMEMMSKGFPVEPKTVVEKLDLPAADKKRWIEFIEQGQQQQQEMQQMQMQAQQQEAGQKVQADVQKVQIKAESDLQKVQVTNQTKLIELQDKRQDENLDRALDEKESMRGFLIEILKLESEDQKSVLEHIRSLRQGIESQRA
jgi:hypothetical protein